MSHQKHMEILADLETIISFSTKEIMIEFLDILECDGYDREEAIRIYDSLWNSKEYDSFKKQYIKVDQCYLLQCRWANDMREEIGDESTKVSS